MAAAGSRDWQFWESESVFGEPCDREGIDSDGEKDFDFDNVDQTTAAELFEEVLVGLKLSGKLNASHVCILAYWAVKGGIKASETLRRLAAKPNSQSGKFSARFDKDLKLEAAGGGVHFATGPVC